MRYRSVVEGNVINGFLPTPSSDDDQPGDTKSARRGVRTAAIARGTNRSESDSEMWPEVVERAGRLSADDQKSFYPLYMSPESGELMIPFNDRVAPKLKGSEENPDAKIKLGLEALHLPGRGSEGRASVRIQISQDGQFVRGSDVLHWIVASGLDLYKQASGENVQRKDPGEVKADLDKAFMGRAVSLPGGAGLIKIEIFEHPEPSPLEQIWASLVSLFKSPVGIALGATVGFPAITLPTVQFFDGLIDRLKQDTDIPIMSTKGLRCVFTERALDDVRLGSLNVFPVLNTGFYVLVPPGHLDKVRELKPLYLGGIGLLKPTVGNYAEMSNEAYLDAHGTGDYPFKSIPYAVLALRAHEANLAKEW